MTTKRRRKRVDEVTETSIDETQPKNEKPNRKAPVVPIRCANRKPDDPVFSATGNVTGMNEEQCPVSNMKMFYQTRKNATPELNFDINLTKEGGEDEVYTLTNEPSKEEQEKRMNERLTKLENDLEEVLDRLAFVKRLRREWNAQKVGLCNRRLKDKPMCFDFDFDK